MDLIDRQPEERTNKRAETHACDSVSRQAAIYAVMAGSLSAATVFGRTEHGMTALKETIRAIKELPSAQPEIIRCKDCKYASPNTVYGCVLGRFSFHDMDVRMYSEDYCSRAERRTDG